MKPIVNVFALVPGPALAHGGHPEIASAGGHGLAHLMLAVGGATAVVVALNIARRALMRRREARR